MGRPLTGALGALLSLIGTAAAADPRLDEKVYSPYVLNGVTEFETRLGREVGGPLDGQTTTVLEIEHGFNDRISLAVLGVLANEPGVATRFNGVGVEGVGYLGRIPGVGVDTGLYLEYKHGLAGEDDIAEAKLLLAKTEGRFQGLLNLILERPLGVPKGEGFAEYGYAASATWQTVGALRLGVEAFGDLGSDRSFLGRQGAYVGPQVKWEGRPRFSPVEIDIDAGWLAAVGPARGEAGSQFRFGVELERRF
ncbi:MAG: hypothetical protein H0X27_11810 [Caulobacteraceae bacterium]|nr:hypothetical protein [Caulobacteraceae bacterium]